ncbi:MAG TPA: arylsulfotransferase family protein [Thermoanaerobaculia bacterium]
MERTTDARRTPEAREKRSRWFKPVLGTSAVVVLLAAAGAYGFLMHAHEIFPYEILKSGYHRLFPRAPHATKPVARHVHTAPDSIQRLANLPYLQGYRRADEGKVIRVYDPERAANGLNLFASGHAPVATLMDMEGKVVRTWTADAARAFPGISAHQKRHSGFLRRVHLFSDGSILALFDDLGLVHLDADSQVLWAFAERTHHDLFVDGQGEIWVISRQLNPAPELKREKPIWEDFILKLSPEGKLLQRLSVLQCFLHSAYAPLLANPSPMLHDILHTNSIRVLDGSLAGRSPLFRRGNLLISLKALNTVAVVDPEAKTVVWALTGQWYAQHSARLLASGNLLLFDNLGLMRPASRILEIAPFSQKVVWSFGGSAGEEMLSETSGFVDRLSNGNTLITESNMGRVLEVTPDRRIVWEFVNPNRVGTDHKTATIYEMERVPSGLAFPMPSGEPKKGRAARPSP